MIWNPPNEFLRNKIDYHYKYHVICLLLLLLLDLFSCHFIEPAMDGEAVTAVGLCPGMSPLTHPVRVIIDLPQAELAFYLGSQHDIDFYRICLKTSFK